MITNKVTAEPFRIKVVEPIKLISREERERKINEAGYNSFNLKSMDVYIDLLSDSGTSAMSDTQWAALMKGDEAYACCNNFWNLEKAVKDVLGYNYVVPTHQGRAAENVLFGTLIKKGDIIPFNMPFDTTNAHVEFNGGKAVNCVSDIAYDIQDLHPFKGNVDLDKLKSLIKKEGKDKIPFIMLTITNNAGGGQPVSLSNIKEVKEIASEYNIPLFLDAARSVENAFFIQQREKAYEKKSISEILKEQFSYADGCTFSCKKDPMVNIGGLIATNDAQLYNRLLPRLILFEGFKTYGGLAGRDLECMAQSLYEMTDEHNLANRVRQVEYLGNMLDEVGIQIIKPIGGHAVYVDASSFLPHIPRSEFPANTLEIELYIESGVRSKGGEFGFAGGKSLTMVRLAIPRRVYTDRHMEVVADGLRRVHERRNSIKGLKVVYEPPVLKHFLQRFERI